MTTTEQKTHGYTGVKRIVFAAQNSYKGLAWMLKNEAAFRQEAALLVLMSVSTLFLEVSNLERVAMLIALLLVMLVETINTSIEAVVDRIGLERHPLSGLAKDLGSSAVFISMTIAAIVWLYVLLT
jgi:diacylglycerol kinase (ATP)